jgi:hypothetical protein
MHILGYSIITFLKSFMLSFEIFFEFLTNLPAFDNFLKIQNLHKDLYSSNMIFETTLNFVSMFDFT